MDERGKVTPNQAVQVHWPRDIHKIGMMHSEPRPQLSATQRGRLVVGVPILALFAAALAVNVGVQVHAYFEAGDSIAFFRKRREELARENPAIDPDAPRSPHSRLGRIEARRGQITEQLLLSLGGILFFGGLAYLGRRTLKRARG